MWVGVQNIDGEVLANIREPYFNRTYKTYCSHQNTPYKLEDSEYPAAVKKGRTSVIEDIPPLNNIDVTIRTEESISKVYVVPQTAALDFVHSNNILKFTVPEVLLHQAVVIEYSTQANL